MSKELINPEEQLFTVRDLVDNFKAGICAIQNAINDLYPGKMKNGVTMYLNDVEVTEIKITEVDYTDKIYYDTIEYIITNNGLCNGGLCSNLYTSDFCKACDISRKIGRGLYTEAVDIFIKHYGKEKLFEVML